MRVLDTNLLVRALVRDDAAQAARAEALLDGNEVGAGADEALLRPTAMPRRTEVMP